ncbi:hypothetical protein ACWEPM_27220 [Streptomyces sp. NPDC004244]
MPPVERRDRLVHEGRVVEWGEKGAEDVLRDELVAGEGAARPGPLTARPHMRSKARPAPGRAAQQMVAGHDDPVELDLPLGGRSQHR